MSKYAPLTEHLKSRRQPEIAMRFADIERVLGFSLPPSSRHHRAWWSNNPSNSVMTKAWLLAGYQSRDVDMGAERLVFVRLNAVAEGRRPARHPLWGAMAGTVTIPDGVDLTAPLWSDAEIDHSVAATAALVAGGMKP